MEVVLGMLFISFSNLNKEFVAKRLFWRSYIVAEALSIAKRLDLINQRKFVEIALEKC